MNQMMAQQEGYAYTPQEYQPSQPAYEEQMMYQQYQQGLSNIISEKTLHLEDIQPIKYKQIEPLSFDSLQNKLKDYLNEIQLMQFTFVLQTFYTEQIDEQQFIDVIHQAFGNRLTFFLFPYIICSIEEEALQLALDKVYMTKLMALTRKSACLLSKCSTYGQLFIALIQDLETEMKLRIMQRQVVFVEKKPCIERQQLIQYIGILTRVKTRDMGRLKYLANLGLTMQNIWQVKHVVFLGHIQDERFRRFFQEFDNEQL